MSLPNARIDQLPQNSAIPPVGYIAMRNMTTGVTERVEIHSLIQEEVSSNFEWVSDNDPGYQTDDVVTRSGNWYQSLIDDNLNIPPETDPASWDLIPKSASGFVLWAAGVYPQDDVFVLKEVSNTLYVFKLASVTRPYVSADFDAELLAGDWEQMVVISTEVVDASGVTVTLDFLGLVDLAFIMSEIFDEPKTIAFDNDDNAWFIRSMIFEIDAAHVLTFPSNVKMADVRWNSGAKTWTPLDAGLYKLVAHFDGTDWLVEIKEPFV